MNILHSFDNIEIDEIALGKEKARPAKHVELSLPTQDDRLTPENSGSLDTFSLSPDKKKRDI